LELILQLSEMRPRISDWQISSFSGLALNGGDFRLAENF